MRHTTVTKRGVVRCLCNHVNRNSQLQIGRFIWRFRIVIVGGIALLIISHFSFASLGMSQLWVRGGGLKENCVDGV